MFKRYCDCCGNEVGLRKLIEANEAGKFIAEGIIKIKNGSVDVGAEAIIEGGGGGTDICRQCAISAIRKLLTKKPKKKPNKKNKRKK